MEVVTQTTSAFRGWAAFSQTLASLDPPVALGVIELIVHALAKRYDGVFDGTAAAPLSPTNLHVIARELIALLPDGALPALDPSAEHRILPTLTELALEVNGLRDAHPVIAAPRTTEADNWPLLWFHHLEQHGLAWSPKLEFGRGWRMFAEIWPDLVRAGRITIPHYTDSPFLDAANMLILSVALLHSDGCSPDVRDTMRQTQLSEGQLSAILEVFTCPLAQAQTQFRTMPRYPLSLQNFFRRHTIIRSSQWAVFAPLPDLLRQCWDLQRLFETLECTLANVTHKAAQRYYGSLGVVFEQYVRELLEEIAPTTGGQSIPPFPVSHGAESPDGFLVYGTDVIVFEAKSYRFPGAAYENVNITEFLSWFAKILGTDDDGRKPLFQGQAFYDRWNRGEPEVTRQLGTSPDTSLYVVVTYEDPPTFCNWKGFRKWYSSTQLEDRVKSLWERTVPISVRGLEALAGACRLVQGTSVASSLPMKLLREYVSYRNTAADATRDPPRMKASFANWLLEAHPWIRRGEPQLVYSARRRLFEAAQLAGFGDADLDAPLAESA